MTTQLFLGLRPDSAAMNRIGKTAESLANAMAAQDMSAVWMEPKNYHITIAFLGIVDRSFAWLLKDKLPTVLTDLAPFDVSLQGLSAVPEPDTARSIWVTVDTRVGTSGNQCGLSELTNRCLSMIEEIGHPSERTEITSHITLARLLTDTNISSFISAFGDQGFGKFRANRLELIEVTSSSGSVSYETILSFPLK